MSERVSRDGDTVTVRDYLYPGDTLIVTPYKNGFVIDAREVEQSNDVAGVITSREDFIALAYHMLALAGEPDWRALAVKLNRLWLADQARYGEAIRGRLAQATADRLHAAQDAITAEEWAAVEGAGDE